MACYLYILIRERKGDSTYNNQRALFTSPFSTQFFVTVVCFLCSGKHISLHSILHSIHGIMAFFPDLSQSESINLCFCYSPVLSRFVFSVTIYLGLLHRSCLLLLL
jgi:hypothetical protein